jgi:hypothetical protein
VGTAMKRHEDDERLDQLVRTLVKASAVTDTELDAAATPFLQRRLWARIAAERERPAASAAWLEILVLSRRTLPAMLSIVALLVWVWLASPRSIGAGIDSRDTQLEGVVLKGVALWSEDDLLALLIDRPVAGAARQEERR